MEFLAFSPKFVPLDGVLLALFFLEGVYLYSVGEEMSPSILKT